MYYWKIILMGLLFLTTGSGIFSEYKIQPQNNSINYTELSPAEIVNLYWQSSIEGNEEVLKQITTVTPASFHYVCQENGQGRSYYSSNSKEEIGISLMEVKTEDIGSKNITTEQKGSMDGKFLQESAIDSPLALAYIAARFIYTNKSPLSKLNVKSEIIYRDESVVQTEYIFSENNKFQYDFLLTNQDGWKIFIVAPPKSTTIENKNYAVLRPQCKQVN